MKSSLVLLKSCSAFLLIAGCTLFAFNAYATNATDTRVVQCKRSDGTVMADSYCLGAKPDATRVGAVCGATCTQSTESRTSTACPAGQSGTITEQRTTNAGNVCGAYGNWGVTGNTCAAPIIIWTEHIASNRHDTQPEDYSAAANRCSAEGGTGELTIGNCHYEGGQIQENWCDYDYTCTK